MPAHEPGSPCGRPELTEDPLKTPRKTLPGKYLGEDPPPEPAEVLR